MMVEKQSLELIYLKQGLQPLKDYFNAAPDKLRFVALLSPT